MISPIVANGVVAQTQNINHVNHIEDVKSQVNYQNSQVIVENRREQAHNTVTASENMAKSDTRHDAKEEGRNKYFNNRNTKKKTEDAGTIVNKSVRSSGFNVSV